MEFICKMDRKLGTGGRSLVYEGFDEETGRFVAIKELPFMDAFYNKDRAAHPGSSRDGEGEREGVAAIIGEIRMMQQATHPNLVQYIGMRRNPDGVQIIMECVGGGSLEGLLARHGKLRESVVLRYTRDILQGLAFLHDSMCVCHRDIKPANVLITTEGRCKLADFGISKSLRGDGHGPLLFTTVGTPWYMAPEVIGAGGTSDPTQLDVSDEDDDYYDPLRGISFAGDDASKWKRNTGRYTARADIWSLGVTVYEMIAGVRPFGANLSNPTAVLFNVIQAGTNPPELPSDCSASPQLRKFLDLCFVYDHTLRPTASELLSHEWIAGTGQGGSHGTRTRKSSSIGGACASQPIRGEHLPTLSPQRRTSHKFCGMPLLDTLDVSATVYDLDQTKGASIVQTTNISSTMRAPLNDAPSFPKLFATVGSNAPCTPSGNVHQKCAPNGVWSSDGCYVDLCTHED